MWTIEVWRMIGRGILESVYMTLTATLFGYVLGLPWGVVLAVTDEGGIKPNAPVYRVLDFITNIMRSIPFLILLILIIPLTRLIVGKSYGSTATIVPLVVSAAPFIARMVESSLKEVDAGVIEAAQSMGANNFQIVTKVLLPEAKPALIMGAVISMVTILGYSAMSATIGGTGLGQIAISYGHQRFNPDIKWICVFLTVIIVQIIQEVGTAIAHRTDKRISK